MNCSSVLSALKADPRTAAIPVIVASILEDRSTGIALGAAEYLVKPVRRDDLERVLRRHCPGEAAPLRVMVVEDDKATREMIEAMLRRAGYTPVLAEHGVRAVERLEEEGDLPAAIVVDLMMPELDGFELIERLRDHEVWRHIPVVVLTAKTIREEDRARLRVGGQQIVR